MSDERLTLKLPMEPLVLAHAGNMLLDMADELGGGVTRPDRQLNVAPDTTVIADPPLPAAAPTVPLPAAAPAAAPTVPLDAEGMPKDARIHGSGNTFLKTGARAGCWKYKKGVDEATIATVEAELKATMAAAPPAPDAVTTTANPPPPPPPETGAGEIDFLGLIPKITALQNANRITPEQVTEIVVRLGVASLALLGTRPDLVAAVNAEIDKLCPPTP